MHRTLTDILVIRDRNGREPAHRRELRRAMKKRERDTVKKQVAEDLDQKPLPPDLLSNSPAPDFAHPIDYALCDGEFIQLGTQHDPHAVFLVRTSPATYAKLRTLRINHPLVA